MNRQPVDEHSTAMCASCTTDLATCDTIWAAEGLLYCSKECCLYDFEFGDKYGKTADEYFDAVAEEINPHDIGLHRLTNPNQCSACSLDKQTCELCTTTDPITDVSLKPCEGYKTYNSMVNSMGFDPMMKGDETNDDARKVD